MTFSDTLRAFDGIVRTLEVRGARSGSLAGTAFVAKDLYDVRGVRTGAGNPDWQLSVKRTQRIT